MGIIIELMLQSLNDIYTNYRWEIRGMATSFFSWVTQQTIEVAPFINEMEGWARFASPIVTILTAIILVMTVMKMIDNWIAKEFNTSLFKMMTWPLRRLRGKNDGGKESIR